MMGCGAMAKKRAALTFCQLFFMCGELITKLETFALFLCDKVEYICVSEADSRHIKSGCVGEGATSADAISTAANTRRVDRSPWNERMTSSPFDQRRWFSLPCTGTVQGRQTLTSRG